MVSGPTNFTHNVHVGFDPMNGIFTGLPKEWKQLLDASSISKEEMTKNPQVKKYRDIIYIIFKLFIKNNLNNYKPKFYC